MKHIYLPTRGKNFYMGHILVVVGSRGSVLDHFCLALQNLCSLFSPVAPSGRLSLLHEWLLALYIQLVLSTWRHFQEIWLVEGK